MSALLPVDNSGAALRLIMRHESHSEKCPNYYTRPKPRWPGERDLRLPGALAGHAQDPVAGVLAEVGDARISDVDLTGADLSGAYLGVMRPEAEPVPDGWKLDIRSGRLKAASPQPGPAEAS